MSATDDAPDEMTMHLRRRRSRALDDADVVGLLRGATPADRPELAGAATLAAALRELPAETPEPRGALAALLRDGFDPAAVTPAADVPLVGRRSAVRRRLLGLAGASLAAKALLGTGVAFAGVAAAATGGVLPDAVHDRVTQIVDLVTPDQAEQRAPQLPVVAPDDVREDTVRDEDDQRRDGEAPTVTVPGPRGPVPPRQAPVVPQPTGPDADERGDDDSRDDEARDDEPGDSDAREDVRSRGNDADGDAKDTADDRRDERAPAEDDARPSGPADRDGREQDDDTDGDGDTDGGDTDGDTDGGTKGGTDDRDAGDDAAEGNSKQAGAPTADVDQSRATPSVGR